MKKTNSIIYLIILCFISVNAFAEIVNVPPKDPSPNRFYLFYLHGRIVEGSNGHPISPDYGRYEYDKILKTFSDKDFIVISEIRENNTDIELYAKKISDWINHLLKAGVPSSRITVVGGSKGGIIATRVSNILRNKKIKFVILAGLFESLIKDKNMQLWGEVLSIYDKADKFPITPKAYYDTSPGISKWHSIITETGLGHGLIYKPYLEWVNEVIEWSGIQAEQPHRDPVMPGRWPEGGIKLP